MVLRYNDIISDLEKSSQKMISDELNIDLVGHLGDKTSNIGNYFANFFNCDHIELPSPVRLQRKVCLAKTLNKFVYPLLPEFILKILSEQYKRLYLRDEKVIKEGIDFSYLIKDHNSLLIVDDNTFTGRTFESWKRKLDNLIDVHTFSITVTGEYRPDYFCIKGWRSFEWRQIGI